MAEDRESDRSDSPGVLHVRVELTRENPRSLKALASVDLVRKARFVLPDDWADLPVDLPLEVAMEMDQSDLGLNLEIPIGLALDNAIRAVFESLFDVDLESGTGPEVTPPPEEPAAIVMSAEELGLEEVHMTPEEVDLIPVEEEEGEE